MNQEIQGLLSCFLPIVIFLIVEMLYDPKYFFKKSVFIGLQYLFITVLALIVFLYVRYTIHTTTPTTPIKSTDGKPDIITYTDHALKNIQNMILFGILLFVFVLISCIMYSKFTNNKIKGIMIFFIYSLITLATIAFKFEQLKYKKEQNVEIDFWKYFTNGFNEDKKLKNVDFKIIIPGLVFGLVFGFIDNAGLISGLDALDTPFSKISKFCIGSQPISNDKMRLKHYNEKLEGVTSGLGNLFSDGLGVTLGAFFGNIANRLFENNISQPIWVDMVGVSLGCILGIIIPITLKNLVSGDIIKDGIFSFIFIKDLLVLSILLASFISICVLIPKKARDDLNESA